MSIYQPAFALTDALIDDAARRGLKLTSPSIHHYWHSDTMSLTLHTKAPGAHSLTLDAMGLDHGYYYRANNRVVEKLSAGFCDTTGRNWEVKVLREIGPLTTYAHLLATDEDEEVAA